LLHFKNNAVAYERNYYQNLVEMTAPCAQYFKIWSFQCAADIDQWVIELQCMIYVFIGKSQNNVFLKYRSLLFLIVLTMCIWKKGYCYGDVDTQI